MSRKFFRGEAMANGIWRTLGTVRLAASLAAIALLLAGGASVRAEDPAATTTSSIIQAGDKSAIDAAMNSEVTIEGVCSEAAWSNSGKVMNVQFKDADESKLMAVVFVKNREKIDQAFGGDATKAWTGAKLRIKGKLQSYGGRSEAMKGRPEMVITDASQVTVVELPPASDSPTTEPTTRP